MAISEREGAVCTRCGGGHGTGAPCDPRDPVARTGEVVGGKYKLGRRLGAGGMGEVYEAKHTFIGRRFAIKLLLPQYARDRDMLARFQREAQSAGALESEHIAAVTDFGFAADGAPYLVMEYLEGEDLGRLLARSRPSEPLAVARAVDLVVQAARGLGVAHHNGIVHRDLKPENLFVLARSDGTDLLKVLDFGIAKLRDLPGEQRIDRGTEPGLGGAAAGGGAGGEIFHGVTRSGAALGTPCYMSPEQARGEREIDQRADIYALGVILYELLSGRKPHMGSSYNAILFHILTQPPEPLGALRPGLPRGLAEVVAGAMAFERDARYSGAAALEEALAPFSPRSRPSLPPEPAAALPSVVAKGAPAAVVVAAPAGGRRADPTVLTPDTGLADAVSRTPALSPPPPSARRGRSTWVAVGIGLLAVGAGAAAAIVWRQQGQARPETAVGTGAKPDRGAAVSKGPASPKPEALPPAGVATAAPEIARPGEARAEKKQAPSRSARRRGPSPGAPGSSSAEPEQETAAVRASPAATAREPDFDSKNPYDE